MSGPAIAIVGGGVFVSRLCELVARALPPRGALRLWARRRDRLAKIAAHAETRMANGWHVRASDCLDDAVDGADAVVLLVRVGGLTARHHDETFPARFGLVGDEGLGPGGFANAFRTLPVVSEIARTLLRACPHAGVYNLVAPLGITTRLLIDEGLSAVGVCELPLVTVESLARASIAEVTFEYVGLNHLGWFWNVRTRGRDVLRAATADGRVDALTIGRFGAAPLRYYYEVFDRAAGARIGIARAPGRARLLAELADRAIAQHVRDAAAEVPELALRATPWFDRALVPMLAALFGGPPHDGFVNVRNDRSLVAELPGAAIIEVAARARATIVPRSASQIPHAVRSFLGDAAAAEDLAYRAAREQDRGLFRDAIARLPLHIDGAALPELVNAALADVQHFCSGARQ